MLILLQPGIQPLGQFDVEDDQITLVKGGEVASFESIDPSDGYAADVSRPGPQIYLTLGMADHSVKLERPVWGLVDEGSSAGLGGRGYGTMFGQVIGATVGQGTGIGSLSNSGSVVVGPSTIRGSGKATLWTKPGLYGVTEDAWAPGQYPQPLNTKIYGHASDVIPERAGKLTTFIFNDYIGYSLGEINDTSLVSTPAYYAGYSAVNSEFCAIYLVGCA